MLDFLLKHNARWDWHGSVENDHGSLVVDADNRDLSKGRGPHTTCAGGGPEPNLGRCKNEVAY